MVNTALIGSVSIITYLLYSTIDKNHTIAEKNKKILVDSMTIVAKVRELKALKSAYETLEMERDAFGLANDSLMTIVASLNQYISEVELKDSVNGTRLAQLNGAIKSAKEKLVEEKKTISLYEKTSKPETLTASTSSKYTEYMHESVEVVEIHVDQMELEPLGEQGKSLKKGNLSHEDIKYIRVKFVILKNALTSRVQKVFSLQLIEPDGKPYKYNPDHDFIVIDRNKIHLTNKKKIEFDGNDTEVTFLYPKATPYKPGSNTVKLFYEDKLVAEKKIFIQ